MTKLYLRHGETFNGDGTSPDPATVDGGVGAFNDFNTLWLGTNPSITSADDVHVFTGGNPEYTYPSNCLFTGNWLHFDNGVEFGGVFGEFTLNSISTSTTYIQYVKIKGNKCFRVAINSTTNAYFNPEYSIIYGMHYEDISAQDHNYYRRTDMDNCELHDCEFTYVGSYSSNSSSQPLFMQGSTNSSFKGIGVTINWNTTKTTYIYRGGTCTSKWRNLTVNGDNENMLFWYCNGGLHLDIVGLHLENGLMNIKPAYLLGYGAVAHISNITVGTDGIYNTFTQNQYAVTETRSILNYPVLNAYGVDVDSKQLSAKVTPYKVTGSHPISILELHKFRPIGGNLTAKVSMLLPDTYTDVTKKDFHILVTYRDIGGTVLTKLSPMTDVVLDTSTDGWSATVYGAYSYDKYEINLDLTDVKDGSIITCELFTNRTPDNADQFYFVDPELQIL